MNSDFFKNLDAALDETATSRRDALRTAGRLGGAAALAVTPLFAMARDAMAAKASTRSASAPRSAQVEELNFALALEFLEAYFYLRAVGGTGIVIAGETISPGAEASIPTDVQPLFETIRDHEVAHVNLLVGVIRDLDAEPDIYRIGDFTYELDGADIFADYDLFLTVAQGFEDAGVRAYKGLAARLQDTNVLTTALQIHSVEARHAAAIRRLRGNQGWIPLDQPGAPAAIAAVYGPGGEFPSEANTTQAGIDITALGGGYSAEQASEAFDEALDEATVRNIVDQFITGEPNDDEDPFGGRG